MVPWFQGMVPWNQGMGMGLMLPIRWGETLVIDYKICKKVSKPNFEFGTTFILWLISKYADKMSKNA